jgi:hypothetical protein
MLICIIKVKPRQRFSAGMAHVSDRGRVNNADNVLNDFMLKTMVSSYEKDA